MMERLRSVRDALSNRLSMSELCARYGVSRRIGYKWLAPYEAEGRTGLQERSRAPHLCPHRKPKAVETWHPEIDRWPAACTAADLLARHGLAQNRRRRRASVHPGVVRPTMAKQYEM